MIKKKQEKYLGEIIRYYCPGLYGKPVRNEKGEVTPYVITVPKIAELKAEELCN